MFWFRRTTTPESVHFGVAWGQSTTSKHSETRACSVTSEFMRHRPRRSSQPTPPTSSQSPPHSATPPDNSPAAAAAPRRSQCRPALLQVIVGAWAPRYSFPGAQQFDDHAHHLRMPLRAKLTHRTLKQGLVRGEKFVRSRVTVALQTALRKVLLGKQDGTLISVRVAGDLTKNPITLLRGGPAKARGAVCWRTGPKTERAARSHGGLQM